MLRMIYASDRNGLIGQNNGLPWKLPSDLRRFKNLTQGGIVVMGRNTYESLPVQFKPLPGRQNVVISTTTTIKHKEVVTLSSLRSFLTVATMSKSPYLEDIWIIGGAKLYEGCIDKVDEIHHTRLIDAFEGDTYFDFDRTKFDLIHSEFVDLEIDQGLKYHYDIYRRKK